jgi:hypothetical protein
VTGRTAPDLRLVVTYLVAFLAIAAVSVGTLAVAGAALPV